MELRSGGLKRRMGMSAVLGALAALGLAPYGLWPITLAILALIPWLLRGVAKKRNAALIGWALGAGYFAHALIWIVEPFLVDVQRHGWMAPFALFFLAGGLALFWAAAFAAAHALGYRRGLQSVFLIATLSLTELARGYVLTGFPWAGLAQIWVDTPVVRLLSVFGPSGLAVLSLGFAICTGLAWTRRKMLIPAAVCLMVLAGGAIFPFEQPAPGTRTVRLVQPNAPQHQKWDPAMIPVFFERQIEYTAAAPRPDLIAWPETAVSTLLEWAGPAIKTIAGAANGVPVAVGIQRIEGARAYNSLILVNELGQVADIYDKHHLVPFGEYIPGGDLAASLGLRGFAAREGDGFSAGPGPRLMDFGHLGKALPLICYEAVFPQDASINPERADFLLQVTNDAWFGEYIGPYQHLAQARMRAVEQGLPMVRVANTGVSAMIDPMGQITAQIPLGQAGFVDAVLPEPLSPPLYARMGDFPVLLVLLLTVCAGWAAQFARNPRNSD